MATGDFMNRNSRKLRGAISGRRRLDPHRGSVAQCEKGRRLHEIFWVLEPSLHRKVLSTHRGLRDGTEPKVIVMRTDASAATKVPEDAVLSLLHSEDNRRLLRRLLRLSAEQKMPSALITLLEELDGVEQEKAATEHI